MARQLARYELQYCSNGHWHYYGTYPTAEGADEARHGEHAWRRADPDGSFHTYENTCDCAD